MASQKYLQPQKTTYRWIVRAAVALSIIYFAGRSLVKPITQQDFVKNGDTSGANQNVHDPIFLNRLLEERAKSINLPVKMFYRCQSGLGHQLLRLSCAYHLAMLYKIPRIYPTSNPVCGGNINTIHNYLLGPYDIGSEEIAPLLVDVPCNDNNVFQNRTLFKLPKHFPKLAYDPREAQNGIKSLSFNNDVAGYQHTFHVDYAKYLVENEYWGKDQSDYQMYSQLMDLFRQQHSDRIQKVMEHTKFEQHTVLGLHVRAGNGETGDFVTKKRGIRDLDAWLNNVIYTLCDYRLRHSSRFRRYPMMIFVATDTESVIHKLQTASNLTCEVPVVSADQAYPDDGKGVTYSAYTSSKKDQETCLNGWRDMVLDMYMISQCNTVIAGSYSSFTQAAPLSIVMHKAKMYNQEIASTSAIHPHYFCELGLSGERMTCYGSLNSWFVGEPTFEWGNLTASKHRRRYEVHFPHDYAGITNGVQRIFKGTALKGVNV